MRPSKRQTRREIAEKSTWRKYENVDYSGVSIFEDEDHEWVAQLIKEEHTLSKGAFMDGVAIALMTLLAIGIIAIITH